MREWIGSPEEQFPGLHTTPLCENDSLCLMNVKGDGDSPGLNQPDHEPDHQLERKIQRVLQDLPGVIFESLVIRRLPSGVCLQGYATIQDQDLDLGSVARGIAGVEDVLDRIVAVRRSPLPPR